MAITTIYYKGDKNKSMQIPSGDASYWENQGWSSPDTVHKEEEPEWYLSNWSSGGLDKWNKQPNLNIDGKDYKFNSPQEYINKMQGLTGDNAGKFINQFKDLQSSWERIRQNMAKEESSTERAKNLNLSNVKSYTMPDNQQRYLITKNGQKYFALSEQIPEYLNNNWILEDAPKLTSAPEVNYSKAGSQQPTAPTSGYQYGSDVLDKKANDASVNALYQSYFGRDAFANELQNWGAGGGTDTTVRALEDYLKSERERYSYNEPIKPISEVKKEYKPEITAEVFEDGGDDNIAKSAEQNVWMNRVKETYDKYKGQAGANKEFVIGAVRATGREPTDEDYNLVGKTLNEVLSTLGLSDKLDDFGVQDQFEIPKGMEKIAHPDLAKNYDNIVEDPTGTFLYGSPKTGTGDIAKAGTDAPSFNDTTAKNAPPVDGGTPNASQTILDQMDEQIASYGDDLATMKADTAQNQELTAKSQAITDAQTISNELKETIDLMGQEAELANIFDMKEIKDATDVIEGQTIPMSVINRQLSEKLSEMSFDQKIDSLVRTANINSKIISYNASLSKVAILEGQYDRAMDIVKETADDWADAQKLKLDLMEMKLGIAREDESEERNRYEQEIEYERDLRLKGYSHIQDTATYDKLVKKLGVTAGNFSQFMYKDPQNNRIYLRPDTGTGNFTTTQMQKLEQVGLKNSDRQSQLNYLFGKKGGVPTGEPTQTGQPKNWDGTKANQLFSQYLNAEYDLFEAKDRVEELTGEKIRFGYVEARQFVKDNPDASKDELKSILLAFTKGILSVGEVNSLLSGKETSSDRTFD